MITLIQERKEDESKEGATAPTKKKSGAKKSTKKTSDYNVDVELVGRIPTLHKYGYDEVRVVVKDVPTSDMSQTVKEMQKEFDKSLTQTRKYHSGQMEVDEIVEYLS